MYLDYMISEIMNYSVGSYGILVVKVSPILGLTLRVAPGHVHNFTRQTSTIC